MRTAAALKEESSESESEDEDDSEAEQAAPSAATPTPPAAAAPALTQVRRLSVEAEGGCWHQSCREVVERVMDEGAQSWLRGGEREGCGFQRDGETIPVI